MQDQKCEILEESECLSILVGTETDSEGRDDSILELKRRSRDLKEGRAGLEGFEIEEEIIIERERERDGEKMLVEFCHV